MTSGIYAIKQRYSGKAYYGSSVNMPMRKRQHLYKLRRGTHSNRHLQSAWDLYGEEAFVFEVVSEVAVEQLLAIEQDYLDANVGGYNVAKNAESAALGLKWSVVSRQRFSASRRGRSLTEAHKRALSQAAVGKIRTAAHSESIRKRMLGTRQGDEARVKIAATMTALWADPGYRRNMLVIRQRNKIRRANNALP